MKIYGFFRGFPGLGRVVSGVSILSELKALGHEVKAYSYLQGIDTIKESGIDFLPVKQPSDYQVMSIGINPICDAAADLISLICSEKPDLVIVDGEALFISTLAMVYPREKILALLNPADLYNEDLPESTMKFYHSHYLSAGSAIVHGIDKRKIVLPEDRLGCDILCTNTILRKSVLDTVPERNADSIAAILGGGTRNASENFVNSTVAMAGCILDAARNLPGKTFTIYCNDESIQNRIAEYGLPENVSIISDFTEPNEIYKTAGAVICRAGRNTISELLYLDLPGVVMSSNGDFRSTEQRKNINNACSFRPGRLIMLDREDTGVELKAKLENALTSKSNGQPYITGNKAAISYIESLIC